VLGSPPPAAGQPPRRPATPRTPTSATPPPWRAISSSDPASGGIRRPPRKGAAPPTRGRSAGGDRPTRFGSVHQRTISSGRRGGPFGGRRIPPDAGSLLLIALHGGGVADVGVLGVAAGVAAGPPLAEEIPALVEGHLDGLEAGLLLLVKALGAPARLEQRCSSSTRWLIWLSTASSSMPQTLATVGRLLSRGARAPRVPGSDFGGPRGRSPRVPGYGHVGPGARRAGDGQPGPTRHRNQNGYLLRWDAEGVLFDPARAPSASCSWPAWRRRPSPASASPISTATTASGSRCPPAAVPRPGGPPPSGSGTRPGPGVLRPAPALRPLQRHRRRPGPSRPRRWRRRPRPEPFTLVAAASTIAPRPSAGGWWSPTAAA